MKRPVFTYLDILPILALHIAFYLWIQPYFLAVDDTRYIEVAQNLNLGQFDKERLFFHRFGLTVPLALAIRWWGIHLWSVTLWPLVASLLTILVVHLLARHHWGRGTAAYAALLLAVNPVQINYSLYTGADIILSLFLLLAASSMNLGRSPQGEAFPFRFAFWFATSLIMGMLTKFHMVFILPWAGLLFLVDLRAGRFLRFWFWSVGLTLVGTLFYLAAYYQLTGDPLLAFKVSEQHILTIQDRHDFFNKTWLDYLQRLTYKPVLAILKNPGLLMAFFLAGPFLLESFRQRRPDSPAIAYWSGWSLTLLAMLWFSSNNYSYYNPMQFIACYTLYILPGLSLLGGVLLSERLGYPTQTESCRGLLLSALFLMVLLTSLGYWKRELILVTLPLLAACLIHGQGRFRPIGWPLLHHLPTILAVLVVVVIPVLAVNQQNIGADPLTLEQQHMAQKYLLSLQEETCLFADNRTLNVLPFYFQNRIPPHIHQVNLKYRQQLSLESWCPSRYPGSQVLLIINTSRQASDNLFTQYFQQLPPDWHLIWRGKQLAMVRVNDPLAFFSAIQNHH